MKVLNISNPSDIEEGPSIIFETDKGTYCIDHRPGTKTKGRLYKGYPMKKWKLISKKKAAEIDK